MKPAVRLFKWSIPLAIVTAVVLAPGTARAAVDDDAAIAAVQDDPAAAYQAAQEAIRGDQIDRAREEIAKVQANGEETWQLLGRSLQTLVDGDIGGARAIAQEAVDKNGDSPWTHFHLGFIAYRQDDWGAASGECDRATQINGDLAYAHYFAGLAFQKQRESAKAADHLRAFLQLAPEAPERDAVRIILRTLG